MITTSEKINKMSAKDIFHNAVKNALQKEKWVITNDPLSLNIGGVEMYIDLGAEKLIAAEKIRFFFQTAIYSTGNPAISTQNNC